MKEDGLTHVEGSILRLNLFFCMQHNSFALGTFPHYVKGWIKSLLPQS